ncbi:FecR family protein [Chitinophaga sp. CF118]|uniref:FecR family protein n=1 Tax=Chitinophaga sp. CF118 TaxID=1884367 RepID=UPI0008DFD8A5|nr:FecR domain-containing protein [Chitinophaga sp. CF118]SFD16097.1 FecR family protein [Chitinophaga sp. CF118]
MKDYLLYHVVDFITDESYLRYYFKENEEDINFWTEWIKLHPEKLDIIISANNYIDAFSVRIPESEFQKEQQRFAQALNDLSLDNDLCRDNANNEEPGITIIENSYKARKLRRRITGALALTFLAVGSIVYVALQKANYFSVSLEPVKVTMIEKYVPKGQREKITLPDGSEVELNGDSKLAYPSKFTGSSRELQLTGEAFFNVKQDSRHPFHITTQNLTITVLGTSFNLQCYPNKGLAKVALVTGRVGLNKINHQPDETIELAPSEMGVLKISDLSLRKTKFDINEEIGWRQGIVVFKNADFNEIADRFDKIYNIRLVNLSHKTAFRFNGSFTKISPEELVKIICLSKQLSFTTNGNVITIH